MIVADVQERGVTPMLISDWKVAARRLKVWRQVIAQVAALTAAGLGHAVFEQHQLADQRVDLRLLANNDLVELLDQVFAVAGFDFKVD